MRARAFVVLVGVAAISAIAAVCDRRVVGRRRARLLHVQVRRGRRTRGAVIERPHEARRRAAATAATPTSPPRARIRPNVIPPPLAARAETTFERSRPRTPRTAIRAQGTRVAAVRPEGGRASSPVSLAFSGATNNTASRTRRSSSILTAARRRRLPRLGRSRGRRRLAVGQRSRATIPTGTRSSRRSSTRTRSATLTLDPSDKKHDTLYLGTGEANRCSSGCEAGVGIYKSKDGGDHWQKLDDACVSTATYPCVTPGHRTHSSVAASTRSRSTREREPHARRLGARRSRAVARDRRGRRDAALRAGRQRARPLRVHRRRRRRSPRSGTARSRTRGIVVRHHRRRRSIPLEPGHRLRVGVRRRGVAPRHRNGRRRRSTRSSRRSSSRVAGTDRTMFALTVKNGHTRIYLTDGTQPATESPTRSASNFWRTDNANQPAATLLASQAAAIARRRIRRRTRSRRRTPAGSA